MKHWIRGTNTPTKSRLMENLGSVIVGALIALAGTVLVQLWLIPLVESRKRREQRWESDVRALGELLTFNEPQVLREVHTAAYWRLLLADPPANADPGRLGTLRREQERAWRTAWSAYDQLKVQADWLVGRVGSLAPRSKALRPFGLLARRHRLAHLELDFNTRFTDDDKPLTKDALDKADDALRAATCELMEELKRLADGRPPRNPTRAGQWLAKGRAFLRGKGRKRLPQHGQPPGPG